MQQEFRQFDKRIDYIRVVITGPPNEVLAEIQKLSETASAHVTVVHGRHDGKSYKIIPSQSGDPALWSKVFECWGQAADVVAKTLTPWQWKFVTRMDWREEIPSPPASLTELELRAHRACREGIRITRDTSRLRSRRNGRDGGGELLGIGSHASDARLTIYKRGTAEYATEAQLSGKQLAQLIETALLEHSMEPFPSMYELMCKLGAGKLRALVLARLAMPFDVLNSSVAMDNQLQIEEALEFKVARIKATVFGVCAELDKKQVIDIINEYYDEYWQEHGGNPLHLKRLPEDLSNN